MNKMLKVLLFPLAAYLALCFYVSRANMENKSYSFWLSESYKTLI